MKQSQTISNNTNLRPCVSATLNNENRKNDVLRLRALRQTQYSSTQVSIETQKQNKNIMRKLLSIIILALLCKLSFSQSDTTAIFQKADSLIELANSQFSSRKFPQAYELYDQVAELTKDINEGNNIRHATALNNIGLILYNTGSYQRAIEYLIECSEIQKLVLGTENSKYASTLNNIGSTYSKIGDYKNALDCQIKAMEIRKKIYGEEHTDYASSLNNIGNTYNNIGDYPNALKFKLGAYKILKKTLGEEHPQYAQSLNNIAVTYKLMGDYQNALKYQIQAVKILKNALGEEHPYYASATNTISIIYSDLCDYQNALKYQIISMEVIKKLLGEEHPDYAQSLNNIGTIYESMGDNQNALKYFLQAMEIRKKTLGENNSKYSSSLNNVGNVYSNMGDNENALKYYTEALEITEKFLGKEHPEYAIILNNIGSIYSDMNDAQNAMKYYIQAMEIRKKVLGEEHPKYASSLINISIAYKIAGDYRNALKYLTQATGILKKVFGNMHPEYASSLSNLGIVYSNMKDYENAIKANSQTSDICKNNLVKNFSFMTTHEREAYWQANSKYFLCNIKYMFHEPNNTLAVKTSYDTELITKGLLLASEISITNTIMESGDSALISEYENIKVLHKHLNEELEKPIAERKFDCDSLETEMQKMERHIMEGCKDFGDITKFIKIDWKDVQNSLKTNDVAIEFSNFPENDTTRYVALVLTKGMKAPVCVPLFDEYEMQKLLRGIAPAKMETPTNDENRGATTVAAKRQGIYESIGLYNLLWKPLEKYFPENPRIYFAPSGMLHQIAVEYAPISHEQTISDKYEIYRVSSTRFLAMDYMPKPMKNSVLYGGIYYDSDTTTMKQESDRYSTRSATSYTSFADFNRNEDRGSLSYLPGTKTEVENIVGTLKKKKKMISTLYEGSQANEESFKALSGSDISILHIATHGFFLPTDEKMSGDQSLIQSGLLLSGANYAWQNQPIPEGVEDGILTAKEISFMDLRQTDLVVLSACQTALGEITGEGVFGLQRGFKKAGVRTIIMSLWPVDDNATLLMMTEFYTNLTKGMSKREAFLAAQNKVKNTAGFQNSRYWAAFIMLDGN